MKTQIETNQNVTVIHGGCQGVDETADKVCSDLNLDCTVFPAKWNLYGKFAGPIRNKKMLDEQPDIVVAFHQNISESRGTKHMLSIAKTAKIPVMLIK